MREEIKKYAAEHNISYQTLIEICIETGFKAIKEMGNLCCSEQVRIICKEWNDGRK